MNAKFWSHFQSREDLMIYKENSILMLALELRFEIEDIPTVASEAITGKSNDKGLDLVYIDTNSRIAVIAQGYLAENIEKQQAPANKASSLNTAVAWILSRDLSDIPTELQPVARSLRTALEAGQITTLEFWYVHNLPQSKNVAEELRSVEHTAQNALMEERFRVSMI